MKIKMWRVNEVEIIRSRKAGDGKLNPGGGVPKGCSCAIKRIIVSLMRRPLEQMDECSAAGHLREETEVQAKQEEEREAETRI